MKMTVRKALCLILCTFLFLSIGCIAMADTEKTRADFSLNFAENGYSHDTKFNSYGKSFVIDVSNYNGSIDFEKVYAAGIDGVMIRVGYRGYAKATFNEDVRFSENYEKAKAAGLKVGVYFYGQPDSISDAEDEAEYVLQLLGNKKLDMPVAYDLEYAEENGEYIGRLYESWLLKLLKITPAANSFCDKISAAGYEAVIYTNKFMLTSEMNTSNLKYPVWMACYSSTPGYDGDYFMWQYTAKGKVDGITGNVDLNVLYTEEIIDVPEPPTASSTESITNPSSESSTSTTAKPSATQPGEIIDDISDSDYSLVSSSTTTTTKPTTKPTTEPTTKPTETTKESETGNTTDESQSLLSALIDLFKLLLQFIKSMYNFIIGLF